MTAILSPCGTYRYMLTRDSGTLFPLTLPPAVFLMLNPSTADATIDDPTIRRCRDFAARWGNNGIVVVNLYALRSTDPAALWQHSDPVGPANNENILASAQRTGSVICAWGTNAKADRVEQVVRLLGKYVRLQCLGINKDGSPKHPLYVRGDTELMEWKP